MSRAGACRSCGSSDLLDVLDLGEMPLADALVSVQDAKAPDARYPLELVFCPACTLAQVLEEVPPRVLFVDNYPYFSSYSPRLLEHARTHAMKLADERSLDGNSLVVEVASNDGYLLRPLAERGIPVLGIDPAPAQAAAAREAGIETLERFLTPELARAVCEERGAADVVVANNVMAHTPALNDFVEALSILLAPAGVATIENAYVRDLVEHSEFDTIYHEHFSYFSTTAVERLMSRHGLRLLDVEHLDIHGGSLRWFVGHAGEPGPRVAAALEEEARRGMADIGFYTPLRERAEGVRSQLRGLLEKLKDDGASIAGYGAAAKATTMLNYCDIGTDLLDFVSDRNPHKHGRAMPGVRIPVEPTDAILERMPDYLLILAWNFADEIIEQQSSYSDRGGRFVVPIPSPSIRS